ncbi:MAG: hydroxyacylglutathione hydrolase [Formosimonas sp.]
MLTLTPIPCRSDNYIWLLHNSRDAWVIDPSLAEPVLDYLRAHNLRLRDVLITHHHFDHVDGIDGLRGVLMGRVIGASARIAALDEVVIAPCTLQLAADVRIEVLPNAGHTYDHVSYFMPHATSPIVFCGDTLFSGGCGRIFDGTVAQLFASLERLAQLPDQTLVACAHEYTLSNLEFALAIDPQHVETLAHQARVQALRAKNEPSLPSSLALEKRINPFLRCLRLDEDWRGKLQAFARQRGVAASAATPLEALTLCRQLKDAF